MLDTDLVRYLNVTNATMEMLEENYITTFNNFMCYFLNDIYQQSVISVANMDISNNFGIYPNFYIIGSYQTDVYINGFTANNSGSAFAVIF